MCNLRGMFILTAIYLETLTWQFRPFCVGYQQFSNENYKYGYPIDSGLTANKQQFNSQIPNRHLYRRDDLGNFGINRNYFLNPNTNQYFHLFYPFNDIWHYQSKLSTINPVFMTPYYLIDLPNQRYDIFNGEMDQSYRFSFDTGNYRKQETSDPYGNINGCLSYDNKSGNYDMNYVSNPAGFQVIGGNLAPSHLNYPNSFYTKVDNNSPGPAFNPNKVAGNLDYPFGVTPRPMSNLLNNLESVSTYLSNLLNSFYNLPYNVPRNRSYYFLFDTGKYKVEEYSDADGNINGLFQSLDDEGVHDLSYVTSQRDGFRVTGGNLAIQDVPTNDNVDNSQFVNDGIDEVTIIIGQATEKVDSEK